MPRKVEPRSRLFQRRLKRDECYATPSERSPPSYATPPTSQENVDGTSERNILRPWRNTSHTKHRRQPSHDESPRKDQPDPTKWQVADRTFLDLQTRLQSKRSVSL